MSIHAARLSGARVTVELLRPRRRPITSRVCLHGFVETLCVMCWCVMSRQPALSSRRMRVPRDGEGIGVQFSFWTRLMWLGLVARRGVAALPLDGEAAGEYAGV